METSGNAKDINMKDVYDFMKQQIEAIEKTEATKDKSLYDESNWFWKSVWWIAFCALFVFIGVASAPLLTGEKYTAETVRIGIHMGLIGGHYQGKWNPKDTAYEEKLINEQNNIIHILKIK